MTAEAMTIDSVLRRGALTFSSRLAVCDGERILSYGELDAEVDALACALLELGVGKGDRVASLMFNQWQALVVYFATVRIGALIVPVNHRLVASEIAFQLNHADCSVLTYAEELSPVVGELRGTAQIRHWITVGSRAAGLAPGQDADYHLESLLGQYRGERPAAGWSVSGSDPSGVWYTSGTTGDPKGAVTTHSSALWAATTMALSMGLHERHRLLGVAPLFHRGPMEDFHLAGFLTGAPHYLMRHFDAAAMLRLIQEHRLTHGFIVPSMTFAVLTLPERGSYDLASMQGWLSASAPFPEEYRERLHRETTLPPDTVYNGYGITESLLNTSLWPQDAHAHPGSVGRAVPGVLLRVVDAERRPVPAGTVGEIAVAAPSMATTYLKNELAWQQATFATDRRTWYLSGDLGRLDDEGFLYIVDRAKDMVISGGENVYSAEVERALTALPGVVEACVVGLPDDRWGECVAALVVLAPGAAVTSGEIVAGCAARLARYKRPRRVFFVGSLPRNAFGKVRKQQVREQVAQLAAEAAC